mgnify:CR=1 FL=1
MRTSVFICGIFLLSTLPFSTYAQQPVSSETDTLLFTFVYLKSGDVFVGHNKTESDSVIVMDERHLGQISIAKEDIASTRQIFKHSTVTLTLSDHTVYTGQFIAADDTHYRLETKYAGVTSIPTQHVVEINPVETKRTSLRNPNATRYFFAPSAIPLERGGGYYQNAYLLSNSVNFGVTNNFSLGGGVIIPLLFYVTPKVGFELRKNLYVGAGLIAGSTFIPDAIISGGIPFGLITVGSEETNLTLGSGYGFLWSDGEFEHTHYPISTVNGMMRISKRIHLITENWIVPVRQTEEYYMVNGKESTDPWELDPVYDEHGNRIDPPISRTEETTDLYMALSLGLRVLVGERSSVDFAPVYLHGFNNGLVIPYLDFVYKF